MDFSKIKKIYMIGIKGVGMTMLAEFLRHEGKEISGSDVVETFMTDAVLAKADIPVYQGFSATQVPADVDLIIYSTAYTALTNEEVAVALASSVPVITQIEGVAEVFNRHYGIAVSGSHGKTTTSAWLAFVLKEAGLDPNAMIGARVPQLGGESLHGRSNYFVLEADEYQNKLKYLEPKIILLNNIDYDHPDFFHSVAEYEDAFATFIARLPKSGILIANADDACIRTLVERCPAKVITYSLGASADYVAEEIEEHEGRQFFKVRLGTIDRSQFEENETDELGDFSIQLAGRHSVSNALAVIAASLELGVDLLALRRALGDFSGTARRLQILGEFKGALIIDDYAHHPTEIKATLEGLRKRYPNKKLRAIFHPHTFTRTKALLDDFAQAFVQADEVIVLDIYGSAREEQGGISGSDVAAKIQQGGKAEVRFIATLDLVEAYLRESASADEIILLMGAGDVFRIGERLLA